MSFEIIQDVALAEELIQLEETGEVRLPSVEQFGPVRVYDKEMRCATRGCASSTHYKCNGIPRCVAHLIRELNQMVHELQGNVIPDNPAESSTRAPDACDSCPWREIARINYGIGGG